MPGVLKERKQRTVLANTMASVCLHARQDLPTKEGKAWPICDLGSSSPYHVGLPLPPSKIRTLLGIQFSGIYCLSYILMIEEQGHHYGTAFLVVLFTFMIYCGRDRRTSQSPGKLFQNIHACPRPLRIWSGPWLRATCLAHSFPRSAILTGPLNIEDSLVLPPDKCSSCSDVVLPCLELASLACLDLLCFLSVRGSQPGWYHLTGRHLEINVEVFISWISQQLGRLVAFTKGGSEMLSILQSLTVKNCPTENGNWHPYLERRLAGTQILLIQGLN